MPAIKSTRAKRPFSAALVRGGKSEMIIRKSKIVSSTAIWPYTPEPSPPLDPTPILLSVEEDLTMSAEELARTRPISVASRRDGTFSPTIRPTLDDVLNNRAPAPYTLAAYTAFLSQQHCLEVLEFTIEAKKYSIKYDEYCAMLAGMPFNTESDEGFELMQDWIRMMDIFVKPGAPREINLPAEERDDLIDYPYEPRPAPPEALEPAVKRMNDLMSDSIFIPFCNSLKAVVPHAHTYNMASDLLNHDVSRHTFNDRYSARPQQSRRKRSPPLTSGAPLEPTRSPTQRPSGASALTSALNRTSSARLSTHISHSSAASDSAMTDDSSAGYSPAGGDHDFMSPPTTPPQSELPFHGVSSRNNTSSAAGLKPIRTESSGSGWKKMGQKIFGTNKKKGSSDR